MSIGLKRALTLFIIICAAGAFCCLAGGVQWGSDTCGTATVLILVAAIIFSGIVYAASQGSEK